MNDQQEPKIQLRIWEGDKFDYSGENASVFGGYSPDAFYNADRFTGMVNALGQKVWEGDIVQVLGKQWEVKFDHCAFIMVALDGSEKLPHYLGGYADCVVVGNIYEGISPAKKDQL